MTKDTPAQKRALLRTATKLQISALCEICLNILAGNMPLDIKKMKNIKILYGNWPNDRSAFEKKALLVNQRGRFLPALAPVVLSALASLVGRVIGDKIVKR